MFLHIVQVLLAKHTTGLKTPSCTHIMYRVWHLQDGKRKKKRKCDEMQNKRLKNPNMDEPKANLYQASVQSPMIELVDFDRAVNALHKEPTGKETDRT